MTSLQDQELAYQAAVRDANLFDCNIWWAPMEKDGFQNYDDFDALLSGCKAAGIGRGIITDIQTATFDNYTGNERLRKHLKEHPGWFGAMGLTPDICFDPGAGTYLRQMMQDGFRAAWLFPKTYEHSMDDYAIGDILDQLEALGLPLMVWHDQVSWDTMDRICTAHPRLNLIAMAHDVKFLYYARNYFSLLRKHDNFYLESHNLVLPMELENLWAMCGKMHVVYGSYFPFANPDFGAYRVLNADIPEQEKRKICFENADRLFFGGKGVLV